MKQSRRMSLVEALANVAVGYGAAVATQTAVFPMFGLHASLSGKQSSVNLARCCAGIGQHVGIRSSL
jgi:hypothetical protein